MNNNRSFLAVLLLLSGLVFGIPAHAQDTAKPAEPSLPDPNQAAAYTEKGADTCLKCHDEDSVFPVFSIFKTKHVVQADKRTPFADLQCEGCHGAGANHSKKVRPGQKQAPIINFGGKSRLSVEKQNQICLECHQNNARIAWKGSVHETDDVACANCHRVHASRDPVLTAEAQPGICFNCHKKERADFNKPSVHPVRFGQMTCSECHASHGSITAHLQRKPTLNETCYTCHAEKRGPFLWEHAPVPEDCTLCHTTHGSIHPALLVKRPPLLCQQCHSQAGHPSVVRTGAGLPGGSPSAFLLGGACLNCHVQIHGSNHPSGVKLMR